MFSINDALTTWQHKVRLKMKKSPAKCNYNKNFEGASPPSCIETLNHLTDFEENCIEDDSGSVSTQFILMEKNQLICSFNLRGIAIHYRPLIQHCNVNLIRVIYSAVLVIIFLKSYLF